MKRGYVAVIGFLLGYVVSDVVGDSNMLSAPARAEVAGMDYYDMATDYDFRRAVTKVVTDRCSVDQDTVTCY